MKNEYFPNYAVHPGRILEETLHYKPIREEQLLGTDHLMNDINSIIEGKAGITPEIAIQLERLLGVRKEFWNNLQANYEADLARVTKKANHG